jgi:hypothetical protein
MNILVRPVFNRPEMLYLSIKYEIAARKYYQNDDIKTIFAVDYGGDPKCLEVIDRYPFEKFVIKRLYRHKVCANIMEALKVATQNVDTYFINLEDDCVLHKTYFKFVDEALKLIPNKKFSVLTTWGLSPHGSPSILKAGNYSCGPGTVISKYFFDKYLLEHATPNYYNNWISTIDVVNKRNEQNPNAKYSAKKRNQYDHLDWDGLMNRLVDTVLFEENVYAYSSLCYRLLHIGFFGFNRSHGRYPKEFDTFEKRVELLEQGIYDPIILEKLDGVYKDYNTFDPQLDAWNGDLKLNA